MTAKSLILLSYSFPPDGTIGAVRVGKFAEGLAREHGWSVDAVVPRTSLANDGGADERPVHTPVLRSFSIARHELTAGAWNAVMGGRIDLPPAEEYERRTAEYFVLRTSRFEIARDAWTETERSDIVDVRWFSPAELAASDDAFDPEDVRGIVAGLGSVDPV